MGDYYVAETAADLKDYLYQKPLFDDLMGIDTEYSSLDTVNCRMGGFSVSLWDGTGMYYPTGHKIGRNAPLEPGIALLKQFLEENPQLIPVCYNRKADEDILETKAAYLVPRLRDALVLVFLDNPDRPDKDLKTVTKEDTGREMIVFDSLFTPEERKAKSMDITTKNPARLGDYAAADADEARQTFRRYRHIEKEFAFATQVDERVIPIVKEIDREGGMELDVEYIHRQMRVLEARAANFREQAHRRAGFTFNLDSPAEVGQALFDRLGLPNRGRTKGRKKKDGTQGEGQYKTDAETLEKIAPQYPIINDILNYKKTDLGRRNYFGKLARLAELKVPVRFKFNQFAAPTFRFSAPGGDPLKDGGTGINIQACSEGFVGDFEGVDLTAEHDPSTDYSAHLAEDDLLIRATAAQVEELDRELEYDGNLTSLPWVFHRADDQGLACLRDYCGGCPAMCSSKGLDVTRRKVKDVDLIPSVRKCFRAPKDWTMVGFDYDRQELVIGANMSHEPSWIRALKNNEDLHALTASDAYQIPFEQFLALKKTNPADFKNKRGVGKVLNFAVFYGGTEYTVANKANLPLPTALQVFNNYVSAKPVLFGWMAQVQAFAKNNGYTTTYFGRRRWLKQFYSRLDQYGRPDKRMIAFANRSAVNTAIQGTGAEICRIAMVKVMGALRKMGLTKDEIRMWLTLHDELQFLVRPALVNTVTPVIKKEMEIFVKSWEVQLSVAPKFGPIWGAQYPTYEESLEHDQREAA